MGKSTPFSEIRQSGLKKERGENRRERAKGPKRKVGPPTKHPDVLFDRKHKKLPREKGPLGTKGTDGRHCCGKQTITGNNWRPPDI